MKKHISILLFVLLVSSFANGQQGNNVVFGKYGGLNFNTSPPTQFTSASLEYESGNRPSGYVSTISDCEGNLLFYTNGDSVWSKNHQLMENGLLLYSPDAFTFNSVVPIPDSPNCYYIIYSNANTGLSYAVVDMAANSGLGKVVSKANTILPTFKAQGNRELGVVKHANGKDFWVIVLPVTDTFYVFNLTKNGASGAVKSPGLGNAIRMRANNSGNMIAASGGANKKTAYAAYVYNFDNATGKISNPKPVLDWSKIPNSEIMGFQFSPNDSILYLTNYVRTSPERKYLFQVKIFSSNPLFFQNTLINEPSIYSYCGMLLAPDNKIYMAEGWDITKIAIIHNPNVFGTGCNLQRDAIDISPARTGFTMGTIYQPVYDIQFTSNARDSVCTDTASFALQGDTSPFKQYILYYGDGDSSILANSNRNTTHKYSIEGKFYVKLKALTRECNFPIWRTDSVTVRFKPKAKFITDSIINACDKRTIYIRDSSTRTDSFTFSWHPAKPIFNGAKNGAFNFVIDSSATYQFTHSVKNDWGCADTFRQSLTIALPVFPTKGFSIDTADSAGCSPHPVTLHDSGKYSTRTVFHWGDGDSLVTTSPGNVIVQYKRTYLKTGVFKPFQIVSNTDGCKDTFYYPNTITVVGKAKAGFSFVVDSTCNNVTITLSDTSKFADSILYTSPFTLSAKAGASALQLFTKNDTYFFKQKAWNKYCADSVSFSIPLLKKQQPDVGLATDKLKGCQPLTITFRDDSTKVAIGSWLLAFGDGNTNTGNGQWISKTQTYTLPGTYTVILSDTAQNDCFNSDTAIITVNALPDAAFTANPVNKCGVLSIDLTDASVSTDSVEILWGNNSATKNKQGSNNLFTYPFSAKDTIHTVTYIAKNQYGCRDTQTVTFIQTAHLIPAIPNMLGVSVTNKGQVTLEWEKDNTAETYEIQHSKNGTQYQSLTSITPNLNPIQTFVQNNLPTDAENIWYKIITSDSCKIKSPESRIAKTILLKAVLDDKEFAVLEWTAYEDWQNGVREYRIEYRDKTKLNPNPVYLPLPASPTTNQQSVDQLFVESIGDERCYRITAIESAGNSYQSYSNEVCLPQRPVIIIPNAFTPNGDGLNDVFTPTVSSIKEVSMDIFNRWGQLMYSETAQQPKWDGTFNGEAVPIDSYLVMIAAKGNNNRKFNYSGIVTLLR